ncbi:hypothetical protein [Aeromonas bivalvium]|uniref:hypothetical protein n=1 Tax=Aeromonas bivalvium TaxID=440079 RepID=UPI0038CF93D1
MTEIAFNEELLNLRLVGTAPLYPGGYQDAGAISKPAEAKIIFAVRKRPQKITGQIVARYFLYIKRQ